MKKILVPIDFSDCSKTALKNAIRIAERMHMELLLYHSVVVPVGFAEGAPVGGMDMGFEEMEEQCKKDMSALVKDYPLLEKIPYQVIIQYGSLQESINDLTKEHDVALVVMGTHGASGLSGALLGSNAYHVMKHVELPVIALPEGADISKMKHIALAGDYLSTPNSGLIQMVVDIAKAFFAQIHIIHIDKGNVVVKDQIDIARAMERYLKNTNHSFHFRNFEDVEEGLLEFAREMNIELLVMVAKSHSFFDKLRKGSHTKKMILDIPMPLMVLHE
jgi:nucleotide-binding universal stress UspA family protein